jgi:two-component system response regulator AtoC
VASGKTVFNQNDEETGRCFRGVLVLPNIPIFHYSIILKERLMASKRILIIDDEENFRHMLSVILKKEKYEVETSANGIEGLEKVALNTFDQILCDIRMPQMDGLEFLNELKKKSVDSTVIMMSAYGTVDVAIEAMKLGAYDYISKPFKPDEIILTLRKAEERERLRKENEMLRKEVKKEYSFENIISKNEKMKQIFEVIGKVAQYKSTILITGESGTGKELVARALHYHSDRTKNPFVPINCGAIPENLLESELFGHTKGAFTDAIRTKKGLFEEADGGTLFLDEIGELPGQLQVKLLRVLQEGEIRRIGESKPIQIDVRIVAATVKDLVKEVTEGRFRNDLFYRLNVLPIHLPPLRERKEDIPLLIGHFIRKHNQAMSKNVIDVEQRVLEVLMNYPWFGNVRELENTIERAIVLSEGDRIELNQLPQEIQSARDRFESAPLGEEDYSIKKASKNLETNLIRKALIKTKGNHTHASRLLEISHRALLYKIKEYGIIENEL